jgi:acetylornithine aminotransferase
VGGEPLFQHARRIPMGDVDAATGAIDEDCAAAIVEPVQGLAGCVPAPVDFLASMRRRCDDVGAVLIFDEVQCGTGRTGAFTAAQAFGVWPHVVTLAKGLAGGFPIGAVLADERTTGAAGKGDLGSTFGGGPLACAAALATLDVLESEGLLDNARTMGGRLFAALRGLPGVVRVQGAGLMVGIVLDRPAAAVRDALLARHRIIVGTSDDPTVLRLLPPLSLSAAQADDFVRALGSVLQ